MGFAENVLNKIRGTPAFKSVSVETFGNWAIEAGDIVTVDAETIPIFSSDMNWNGSAITTIACTGNQKREIQDKRDRKDYAMESGLSGYTDRKTKELADSFGVQLGDVRSSLDVYVKKTEDLEEASAALTARVDGAEASLEQKAESKTVQSLSGRVSTVETAQNSLTARVGSAESSLEQKAEKKTVEALDGRVETVETAQAGLSARVDGAEASIELNAQNINGVASSVADIEADVINLKGRVDVTGVISVENGVITSTGQIISHKNIRSNTGLSSTKLELDTEDFTMAGKSYTPKEITSTTGTVRVLGIA